MLTGAGASAASEGCARIRNMFDTKSLSVRPGAAAAIVDRNGTTRQICWMRDSLPRISVAVFLWRGAYRQVAKCLLSSSVLATGAARQK